MSNLKHYSLEVLKSLEQDSVKIIGKLTGKINNEETRLTWIRTYIKNKTVTEMTIEQVEEKLGHKVKIIKETECEDGTDYC